MAQYRTLLAERIEPGVLRVTLNRPQVANALNTEMVRELLALWSRACRGCGDIAASC